LIPLTCCGVPIWLLKTPTSVQRDFDDVKPGMTVEQVIVTFPHELSVDPAYESSPTLPEYLRRNDSLKHFSGILQDQSGERIRFRGNLLNTDLSVEEIKRIGIKPKETALQFVARHPQWRVDELFEDHREYFKHYPDHGNFTGKLSHFPQPPIWRMREMNDLLVIELRNGRVTRTLRVPISD
jgi:hypothetical protein